MYILVLDKMKGIGGEVTIPHPIHVHFQPYAATNGIIGDGKSSFPETLYLRHLAIYLLNKYFIKIGVSQNQHIPMPLGEVYKFGSAIGMLSEYVYGTEHSSYYSEHLDWEPVKEAFAGFGFSDMASDYLADSEGLDHNHFNQNRLYPDEEKAIYQKIPGQRSLEDRYSTARWMRIDFEPRSFDFRKERFIAAINQHQEALQNHLTAHEHYFLLSYKKIIAGEPLEEQSNLQEHIFHIRQENMQEVYERQVGLVRRWAAISQLKINAYNPDYVSTFLSQLDQMPHTLAELRAIVDKHLYKSSDELDKCVMLAMEQLRVIYGEKSPNATAFFSFSKDSVEVKMEPAPKALGNASVSLKVNLAAIF